MKRKEPTYQTEKKLGFPQKQTTGRHTPLETQTSMMSRQPSSVGPGGAVGDGVVKRPDLEFYEQDRVTQYNTYSRT